MSLFTLTVQPQRAAVAYRHGRLEGVLGAGRHARRLGRRLVHVDLRERLLTTSPQEVPTADGVVVRVTAAVRWSVAEPRTYVERAEDPVAHLYLAVQVALRDALGGLTVEELTRRGAAVPVDRLTGAAAAVAVDLGMAVAEVLVKDVILPAEVRHAATEVATARQRGAAQLEAARAETAALRSLANAAKLLDASPALAQLRLVQSAPIGSQLVLRLGEGDGGATRS